MDCWARSPSYTSKRWPRKLSVDYLCIPRHFSEPRPYATVGRFGPEVISGDANFIEAGQRVLDVRAEHPDRSLADHYNPLAMSPDLGAPHNNLDRYVDRAFGATKPLQTNEERQTVLLERYQEMTED